MNKYSLLAAAVAVACVASPAAAQEFSPFAGGKVGVLVGVDSVVADDGVDDGSEEDVMYGVTAGYDFSTGSNLVFGVEAELSGSEVGVGADDVLFVGDRVSVSAGRDIYVGGRIGAGLGSALVYAKGGYTNAKLNGEYFDGADTFKDDVQLDGFRIGGGVEVPVGSVFSVRAEYRYSDYGELEFDGIGTGIDMSRHQGVVALVSRF